MMNTAAVDRHLLVLASGPFGKDVAGRLERHFSATVQDIEDGTHPSAWPHADLIVLATSHERPRIAEALDRAAFAWRIPWFAVLAGATDIQCGPLVLPGRTACHRCFVRRRDQHVRAGHADHAAAANDGRYPSGYPGHHVGIATAFARQAVAEAFGERAPGALGGTVRRFNQISGATSRASVVAVDRCLRCRPRPTSEDLWRGLAASDKGGSR
ncbi:hypothetical protein DQ384_14725 [Sphaerisporangium album]|uniref:TOMM leader peptide-binding protein n=1 Tax=Sphaerisporangium album TaxID=509200 RepID=A0A367FJJ7_9ACTN|nr:hypothetical protein [Sphaerisporangium album]RCG30556.1 hypothetical protein DQ384_14725 [Sphaerisporangium album]